MSSHHCHLQHPFLREEHALLRWLMDFMPTEPQINKHWGINMVIWPLLAYHFCQEVSAEVSI